MSAKLRHRKILGERIRSRRLALRLTQEKLAEKSDLHHNFIGEVERANMEISLTSLLKIARALNLNLKDLVAEL
jgi:transcriptional regulator with XRE-family HTH domain